MCVQLLQESAPPLFQLSSLSSLPDVSPSALRDREIQITSGVVSIKAKVYLIFFPCTLTYAHSRTRSLAKVYFIWLITRTQMFDTNAHYSEMKDMEEKLIGSPVSTAEKASRDQVLPASYPLGSGQCLRLFRRGVKPYVYAVFSSANLGIDTPTAAFPPCG